MKAMIFAAGKGTRLGVLTKNLPKVLIDVNGKSVLQLAVEKCTSSGFDDIIINTKKANIEFCQYNRPPIIE